MTDFELNKAIAEALYPDSTVKKNCDDESIYIIQKSVGYLFCDYLNDWNDLMPLVVERQISLFQYKETDTWQAYVAIELGCQTKHSTFNKNPQRALAECVLKVLEAK